jgi:kynureninase
MRGVVADHRSPDLIRVAPIPLYSTFHEAWSFARILAEETGAVGVSRPPRPV